MRSRLLLFSLMTAAALGCGGTTGTESDAGQDDAGLQDGGSSDAGHDAGLNDAGPNDAGLEDAGSDDAGVNDAGSHDAGSNDAGIHDAGSHDAGISDAGANDAGANDAGATDAGLGDAGVGDAGLNDAGPDAGCLTGPLLDSLGKSSLLIGATMADATAAAAPFDVRYIYLAGGIPDGAGPCQSCATSCASHGNLCDNQHGCGWWGCYQWDQLTPGQYAGAFVTSSQMNAQIPMFTYYELLQSSGANEGSAEVAAANNAAFMSRYFNDFRYLLQQIGSHPAFLHLEPDFWGYAEQVNANANLVPAKVASANSTDCASEPESIAGMGRCMIAMVRKYAPHAKVGLHGSPWATGVDVGSSSDPNLDVAGEARKLAAFLVAAGAGDADFIVVDASDRDAGWYASQGRNTFWDPTNQTLPDFHQAFQWTKALGAAAGKPVVYWQVPLGNAQQGNTNDHWQDNRVDYFFAHTAELAAANVVGIFFGAGASAQTTPETDGNNLINQAKAYAAAPQTECH
jgi:hypothetical protein